MYVQKLEFANISNEFYCNGQDNSVEDGEVEEEREDWRQNETVQCSVKLLHQFSIGFEFIAWLVDDSC